MQRSAVGKRNTSNLERYERIAPFYDLLDLPFEIGRYRRIRNRKRFADPT
jgi:hypothetical protein